MITMINVTTVNTVNNVSEVLCGSGDNREIIIPYSMWGVVFSLPAYFSFFQPYV